MYGTRPLVFVERKRRQTQVRLSNAEQPQPTWQSAGRALVFWGILGAVVVGGFLYLGVKEGFTT